MPYILQKMNIFSSFFLFFGDFINNIWYLFCNYFRRTHVSLQAETKEGTGTPFGLTRVIVVVA